jgi:hypothetical protein
MDEGRQTGRFEINQKLVNFKKNYLKFYTKKV